MHVALIMLLILYHIKPRTVDNAFYILYSDEYYLDMIFTSPVMGSAMEVLVPQYRNTVGYVYPN